MNNIVAKRTLTEFWKKYPDSEKPLRHWYNNALKSKWMNFSDIKKDYGSADIVADSRVIFNIDGNKYRLIVKFNFLMSWGWIRFIGTHGEYDKINPKTI
ncbi:MAG: type II toxin-antitoxin system HigB family toxin [Bacteroidota bacterium]